MITLNSKSDQRLADALLGGGLAVLRTDTLYGLVGRADNEATVKRIYELKHRQANKPLITLIASVDQLYDKPSVDLGEFWPGPNSLILPSPSAPNWLKNPDGAISYRLPNDDGLIQLISRTGPLVAPSANLEGQPPAINTDMAYSYFGDNVDIYVEEGDTSSDTPPSKLWQLNGTDWARLR